MRIARHADWNASMVDIAIDSFGVIPVVKGLERFTSKMRAPRQRHLKSHVGSIDLELDTSSKFYWLAITTKVDELQKNDG